MILTVALNATVNVSYEAEQIAWGAPNHISRMTSRAGGGSLAVARVLAGLGEDVLVAGFAGGGGGDLIEADLARAGVATAFTRIGRESRRVIEVLDEAREESTRLSEPAPFITTEELGRFAGEFRKLLPGLDAVVLSGALAAGLPLDMYASLASYAAEASVPAIVHAGGPVLWRTLDRHPALVLIASTAGVPGAGVSESPAALLARGSRAAVMLSGAALLAAAGPGPARPAPGGPADPGPAGSGPDGQWRAALEGYPGLSLSAEAVVAGLLPAVTQGWSWPDALRHAVALGASADLLGEVDLDAYDLLSSEVVLVPAGESSPA
ncbi:MAG TPA: PfkB family carbohydrate kinase [Streptosporangiaceae bacterium]